MREKMEHRVLSVEIASARGKSMGQRLPALPDPAQQHDVKRELRTHEMHQEVLHHELAHMRERSQQRGLHEEIATLKQDVSKRPSQACASLLEKLKLGASKQEGSAAATGHVPAEASQGTTWAQKPRVNAQLPYDSVQPWETVTPQASQSRFA